MAPKFSIIIPTCHRNDLLAACLERLAPGRQTIAPESYEVVVSDDGSRSTAQDMIGARFPWARWIKGPQRGPAANRNHAAAAAEADWLLLTDDDCLPESEWVTSFAKAIASGSASVYEGRTYTEENTKGPFWSAPSNETGGYLWSCNMAIRRELLKEIGGFDDLFPYPHMEDVDLRERLKAGGHSFVFCPEAAVFHPLRPVTPVRRQAMSCESYFYYARKHGISLSESGLSVRTYLKARMLWMDSSRGITDAVRFISRSLVETALIVLMIPWWLVKFRLLKVVPESGSPAGKGALRRKLT
jgi:GT2 family glycosyltransferase